jgi:predicted component of type VI protein secretion system
MIDPFSMRIFCSYHGKRKSSEIPESEFVFGRTEDKFPIGLDLTPDAKVSRLHGRIWFEKDAWWIEDRKSSRGTRLNGVEIKGQGKQQLRLHDTIEVGDTALPIESLEVGSAGGQTSFLEVRTALIASAPVWKLLSRTMLTPPTSGARRWSLSLKSPGVSS